MSAAGRATGWPGQQSTGGKGLQPLAGGVGSGTAAAAAAAVYACLSVVVCTCRRAACVLRVAPVCVCHLLIALGHLLAQVGHLIVNILHHGLSSLTNKYTCRRQHPAGIVKTRSIMESHAEGGGASSTLHSHVQCPGLPRTDVVTWQGSAIAAVHTRLPGVLPKPFASTAGCGCTTCSPVCLSATAVQLAASCAPKMMAQVPVAYASAAKY